MFSTYTRDALAALLGCTTTNTTKSYVLASDGLWLRVDWQAWQNLTDQERSAVAGNGWPMCQHDAQDKPVVANDGTALIGRFGREPLLRFPFTALQLWEYDRDTGGTFSEHLPLDSDDWIAERLAEAGPGNEAVVCLARVLLADRPPQDEAQARGAEKEADFMDATLDAAMFFALPHVTPWQAAMLLCRFNPHNEAEKDAENCTTDCTKPEDFKRLRTLFNSVDQATPASRSLLDWMEIADEIKCKYHPWAWRYVNHRELDALSEPATDTALPASVVTDSARPASAPSITAAQVADSAGNAPNKARRNLLSPVIEAAQREAENSLDAPAVWASLTQMAMAGKRPLLGITEEGIKWLDANDESQFFTLKNLRDRLHRSKRRAP